MSFHLRAHANDHNQQIGLRLRPLLPRPHGPRLHGDLVRPLQSHRAPHRHHVQLLPLRALLQARRG